MDRRISIVIRLFLFFGSHPALCTLDLLSTTALKMSVENVNVNFSGTNKNSSDNDHTNHRYNSTLCLQQIDEVIDGVNSQQQWAIESEFFKPNN